MSVDISTIASPRFHVGDMEITRITEISFEFPVTFLFPEWQDNLTEAQLKNLHEGVLTPDRRSAIVYVNSWVVRTPNLLFIVDTGIGDGRVRHIEAFNNLNTGYLERMKTNGIDPHAVDFVFCTHLHSDHVGWNTHLSSGVWVPTFPSARYLWSRGEHDWAAGDTFRNIVSPGVYEDSVRPIVDAGLVDVVPDVGAEVIEGVMFHPTPGHTPGHMSISIRSGGGEAFFSGDVIHNPIQIYRPEWNSAFCENQDAARKSRHWMLEYTAESGALVLPAHFGANSAGYVKRESNNFRWIFA
ncbi:beta-lactamase [Burkholderia lata]|uniref:Beta-lactamase n=1 Tax=Burkholderia lata (strain ATCC 17760 / DSM 23089 / LMG 22485 / NCIMB 9086 / R18194 / 383) TaxID=482957 RepID=A0A6P2Y8X3_BURL3|nr:MBL fold metallo-hydrolase [Burkholderia lata]VWD18561.1 beta-lactamase [Burkholderia lata]